MQVRLQKYLADAGIASRRKAEELILNGQVKVNGVTVTELGTKIDDQKEIYIADETIKEIIISIDSGRNLQDRLDSISSPTRR